MRRQLFTLFGLPFLASCVFDTSGYSPYDTPAPDLSVITEAGSLDHPRAPDGRRPDRAIVLDRARVDARRPPDAPRPADTRAPDTRAPDTRSPDSRRPDVRPPDTRPPDSPQPDTASCFATCGGCCLGGPYGVCALGDVNSVCGGSGATCQDCTTTGKVCLNHACKACTASAQCQYDAVCLSGSCVPALPRKYRITINSAKVSCGASAPKWDPGSGPDLMVEVSRNSYHQFSTTTANDACAKTWTNQSVELQLAGTDMLSFLVADDDGSSSFYQIGELNILADQLLPQLRSGKSEQLGLLLNWSAPTYVEELWVTFTPLP